MIRRMSDFDRSKKLRQKGSPRRLRRPPKPKDSNRSVCSGRLRRLNACASRPKLKRRKKGLKPKRLNASLRRPLKLRSVSVSRLRRPNA